MSDELVTRLRKLNDAHDAEVIDDDAYQAGLVKLRTEYGAALVDPLLHQQPPPSAAPRSHTLTAQGDAQIGVAVAGDIYTLYVDGKHGKTPKELLRSYLESLSHDCGTLPLQGVREQKTATDVLNISLDQVYTQLATTELVEREVFEGEALSRFDAGAYLEQHVGELLLPNQQRLYLHRPKTPNEQFDAVRDRIRARENYRLGSPAQQPITSEESGTLTTQIEFLSPDVLANIAQQVPWLEFSGPQLVTETIAAHQRLVLLGEPGSGKSTALRYLALMLARAGLDARIDLSHDLAGWQALGAYGTLIPLFMPLLPFAKHLAAQPKQAGTADDLWNQIADQLQPKGANAGLATVIHDELLAGRLLLLLDGLDEVASEDSRRQVIQAVAAFAARHHTCRIIVTCRVRAYDGERNRAWQLDGWPIATLADWTLGQMTSFIHAWYTAATAPGGVPAAKRDERIATLQRAVTTRTDLQRLGVRPLLLTIMALVHLNDGRLPEDRVTLYQRCIDILLAQWEVAGKVTSDYGALTDYIGLPDTNIKSLRPLLTHAAFLAHSASAPGSPGRLGRAELRELVMQALVERKHPNPYDGANRFLAYTDVRTGLLHASDAGDAYVFPHQTFQEYLAGLELVSGVDFVERIMDRRNDDRWHVPILLGIGHLVGEGALAMPHQLLTELLAGDERAPQQQQRDLLLAAEIAEDVGWDRLERGGASFKRLRRDLAGALAPVVEGSALPAAERVQAGAYLARLGDLRPGVCTLPPAMIPIAGGSFVIGESRATMHYDDEINDQPLTLLAFELARYPVTNAQYALFVADNGYDHSQPWWDAAGKDWLRAAKKPEPRYWNDQRFGIACSNHPVVGVSWYEASAFCCWLTQRLNDGWLYTLLSEAEWEYAARGSERRPYPWGADELDDERANFGGTNNGTTAVGCFPSGATPEGLLDMAGNVWEWTRSIFTPYPYDPEDGRETSDNPAEKSFTLRGGGWDNRPILLRASSRLNFAPDFHDLDVGFRLARHHKV